MRRIICMYMYIHVGTFQNRLFAASVFISFPHNRNGAQWCLVSCFSGGWGGMVGEVWLDIYLSGYT